MAVMPSARFVDFLTGEGVEHLENLTPEWTIDYTQLREEMSKGPFYFEYRSSIR